MYLPVYGIEDRTHGTRAVLRKNIILMFYKYINRGLEKIIDLLTTNFVLDLRRVFETVDILLKFLLKYSKTFNNRSLVE